MKVEYTGHTGTGHDVVGRLDLPDDATEDQIEQAVFEEVLSLTEWSWQVVKDEDGT